jgi:hypothetical protein
VHQIRRATYGSDCTITVHVTMIRAPIFVCVYIFITTKEKERERELAAIQLVQHAVSDRHFFIIPLVTFVPVATH